jgi:hypothetical protein
MSRTERRKVFVRDSQLLDKSCLHQYYTIEMLGQHGELHTDLYVTGVTARLLHTVTVIPRPSDGSNLSVSNLLMQEALR